MFWCTLLGLVLPVVWFVGVWLSVPKLKPAPDSKAKRAAFGVAIAGTVFASLTLLLMIVVFSTIRGDTFGAASSWGGTAGNFYILLFLVPVLLLCFIVLVILTALFLAFANSVFLKIVGAAAHESGAPVNLRGRTLGWGVAALVFPFLTWVAVPVTLSALGKPAFKLVRRFGVQVLGVASFVAQLLFIVVLIVISAHNVADNLVVTTEFEECGSSGSFMPTTCSFVTRTFVIPQTQSAAETYGWIIAIFWLLWLVLHLAFTIVADNIVTAAIAVSPPPTQQAQPPTSATCPSCSNAIAFVPAASGVTRVTCTRCKAEVEFETTI